MDNDNTAQHVIAAVIAAVLFLIGFTLLNLTEHPRSSASPLIAGGYLWLLAGLLYTRLSYEKWKDARQDNEDA